MRALSRLRSSASGRRRSGELQKHDRPDGASAAPQIARSAWLCRLLRDRCSAHLTAAWAPDAVKGLVVPSDEQTEAVAANPRPKPHGSLAPLP
jgi:hypothetical protein